MSPSTLAPLPPNRTRPRRLKPKSAELEEALDDVAIAELSSHAIRRMTRTELERVVRAARTLAADRRLMYFDRSTLQRLAHQARLCSQQRIRLGQC